MAEMNVLWRVGIVVTLAFFSWACASTVKDPLSAKEREILRCVALVAYETDPRPDTGVVEVSTTPSGGRTVRLLGSGVTWSEADYLDQLRLGATELHASLQAAFGDDRIPRLIAATIGNRRRQADSIEIVDFGDDVIEPFQRGSFSDNEEAFFRLLELSTERRCGGILHVRAAHNTVMSGAVRAAYYGLRAMILSFETNQVVYERIRWSGNRPIATSEQRSSYMEDFKEFVEQETVAVFHEIVGD
jgi:hypothetical protein